ncbi:MAG: NAD(P)-dependent oxidoreductase [Myxococcota bacterium]
MRVLRWNPSSYETEDDLTHEAQDLRSLGIDVRCLRGAEASLAGHIAEGCDVLVVTSGTKVGPSAIEGLAGRAILTTTSGYDHIDLDACRQHRVAVGRSPDVRRDAVVEYVMATAYTLLRRLPSLHYASAQGEWCRSELPTLAPRLLRDATAVVVGLGVIGQAMTSMLQRHGVQVIGVDPYVQVTDMTQMTLDEALPHADLLTLHCSATASSKGLIGASRLKRLKRGAVVINSARGAVLNLSEAVQLLDDGHLGGLAVDVFPREPWPDLATLTDRRGILVSPHAAGFSSAMGTLIRRSVTDSLVAWRDSRQFPWPVHVG